MAYAVEQKAAAIAIVNRHDGQVSAVAIDEIRDVLGLPNLTDRTVRNWVREFEGTEISAEIPQKKNTSKVTPAQVEAADEALDEMYERAARKYLKHALSDDIVAETKGPQAIIAAATATDKMRLLRGLPTEILGILPGLIQSLEKAGENPMQVFTRLKEVADAGNTPTLH